ncbi:MAG: CbtA family protein [Nitrososphaeraceae archaeon]
MKTVAFILITLISGAIAGTILGLINLLLVEPYIDQAIEIEVQNTVASDGPVNMDELVQYRLWQKGGEIVAGTILGISVSALFGIIFVYSRDSLPGSNNKKKGLILAGIVFSVLFLIPALKYPGNPPAVGDPETVVYRQSLYIGMLTISGFSALALALLYRATKHEESKKVIISISIIYAAIIAIAFIILPSNPDDITIPMDLLMNFRIVSTLTMGIFWGILGITLGSFWDKAKPHETAKIATI